MFIVFDGVDGAGKSTQLMKTAEWLRRADRTVVTCADPGSTGLGKALRRVLLDHHETAVSMRAEMLMFMAARAQLVDEVIRPAVARGEWVLCDRYTFSTVVYQGAAGGLPSEEIWAVNRAATGGLWPDLTLLFDLPIESAAERMKERPLDRMESRGSEYFERVRQGFLSEADRWPRGVDVIDGRGNVEAVFQQVLQKVSQLLEKESA